MTDEARGPWELAIAFGAAAGRNWAESRRLGGLKGLDRIARRWSSHAETAINLGLERQGEQPGARGDGGPTAQFTGEGGSAGEGGVG